MRDKIVGIVSEVVEELNQELEYEWLRSPRDETILYSGGDGIDSLSLVWLVVETEARINEEFDVSVALASEKAMSMRNSPYRSVGAFADFIQARVRGEE